MSAVITHRCRFIDYTPTPITALAFPSLLPVKNKKPSVEKSQPESNFLAIGRSNGNIEVHTWSIVSNLNRRTWSLCMILSGSIASKVDALAFSLKNGAPKSAGLQSYRLFSSGGGSNVVEWDLSTGLIRQSLSSQGGSIWSMAINPTSTRLALGCEDGSIRILSLEDDQLIHWRRLDRVKTRLLSVAWGPPIIQPRQRHAKDGDDPQSSEDEDEDEDETENWQDSYILAGCSDSSIRKFDVQSGRSLERMTVDKLRGEGTLVWAISVLADGTFVSGDSLGNVKFWDSITSTQLHSFTAHGADVLCLAVGQDGNTIYSSGVDQKICQFSKVRIENSRSKASIHKWVNTGVRRLHSHDVRALAVWPSYTPVSSDVLPYSAEAFLASGGLDMSLVICSISKPDTKSSNSPVFDSSRYERLPYKTSFSCPIQLARNAKLVLCRRSNSLTLWRINPASKEGNEVPIGSESQDSWEEILEMELQLKNNLVASAISNDGSWIAASSSSELKLFRLIDQKGTLKPKPVTLDNESELASIGATSLSFSDDNSKLIVGGSWSSSKLYVVDLVPGSDTPRLLRCFDHHLKQDIVIEEDTENTDQKRTHLPVSTDSRQRCTAIIGLATSIDGQWLASSDDLHRIHIFNLDSLQHHCALPSFPHPVINIVFDPLNPSVLVIALANNTFQVFDVEAREFPYWSKNLEGYSTVEALQDPLLGVTFDYQETVDNQKENRHVVLWGSSWICKVSLGNADRHAVSKKRRRERRQSSLNNGTDALLQQPGNQREEPRIIRRYRPLLLVDFIGPGELVVVERPLVDLLSSLPPAYYKPRYGT